MAESTTEERPRTNESIGAVILGVTLLAVGLLFIGYVQMKCSKWDHLVQAARSAQSDEQQDVQQRYGSGIAVSSTAVSLPDSGGSLALDATGEVRFATGSCASLQAIARRRTPLTLAGLAVAILGVMVLAFGTGRKGNSPQLVGY